MHRGPSYLGVEPVYHIRSLRQTGVSFSRDFTLKFDRCAEFVISGQAVAVKR
ncbi:hypothetical protein BaRGS_00006895, partial [Batillaria attramentaria]